MHMEINDLYTVLIAKYRPTLRGESAPQYCEVMFDCDWAEFQRAAANIINLRVSYRLDTIKDILENNTMSFIEVMDMHFPSQTELYLECLTDVPDHFKTHFLMFGHELCGIVIVMYTKALVGIKDQNKIEAIERLLRSIHADLNKSTTE